MYVRLCNITHIIFIACFQNSIQFNMNLIRMQTPKKWKINCVTLKENEKFANQNAGRNCEGGGGGLNCGAR